MTVDRKIVCLIGRRRDWRSLRDAEVAETLAGNIVLTVGCIGPDGPVDHPESLHGEKACQELHFDKIRLADEVVCASAELGEHTRADWDLAERLGKPIRVYVGCLP
jgi:hypothetical protein